MENITVGIVSGNRDYGKALGLSLMSVCDEFIIHYYDARRFISEWNAYKGEGLYTGRFDLILWDGPEMKDSYTGNIVYLAEKASLVRRDFAAKKFSLYKYSGGAAMAAALFEIYTCLTGRGTVFIRKDSVRLFAFGAWDGGVGSTTVTLAVAQELRRFHGSRVLVLSLEAVESTARYFQIAPEMKRIGEYLYRVLPEESLTGEKTMPFLDSYIVRDLYGVEAFAPSGSSNPLPALGVDEIQKFLASLIDNSRYDAILIDMGTCLTKAAVAVMEMADRTCFITGEEAVTHREEMYLSHVVLCADEGVLGKAVRLTNRSGGREGQRDDAEARHFISSRTFVRSFENAETGDEPRQLILEGGFGEDIRKLSVLLLE